MAFLVAGYGEGSYWESSPGFGSPSSEFEASYSGDSVNACEYAGKKMRQQESGFGEIFIF